MVPAGMKNKSAMGLSLLIFLVIIAVAVKYRTELSQTLRQTDGQWLIVGIVCYFINYLCRAYRIRSYSHNQLRLFPDTLRLTCLHGFASYFLPMRSGDLTLPALLKLYHGMPLILGSRILLRARLLDILSLGLLLTGATLFSAPQLTLTLRLLFLITGLAFIGLPYLLVALVKWKKEWLFGKLHQLESGEGKDISYPSATELLQSLAIWFWTGCSTFCVIRSLDIPLAFLDVWFFAAIQLPLQLLPVQGLANSGNHEAGWLAALNLLGITPTNAMAVTLASHVILIAYVILLGGVAALLSGNQKKIRA